MARLPLEHVRILDFGTALAGPIPGMLLGDMGAQVMKVEAWNRPDPGRFGGGAVHRERAKVREDLANMRTQQHSNCRDKLGITLDMITPEGLEGFRELVKISDVVIDNFGPGVTKRLGIDYLSLRKIRPDIIAVSTPVAGQEGPWRDTRGYAVNMTGLSGLTWTLGYSDEPHLTTRSPFLGHAGDWNAGESAAMGILLALAHRQRTGEGQFIDNSAAEGSVWLLGEPIMDYVMNGRVAGHQGNLHPTLAPHGTYPCQGDDKWVSIAVDTEGEWQSLCQATGNSHWVQDERFQDKYSRMKHRDELDRLIGEWTRNYKHYEVTERLQKAGVAAAPVLDALEQYEDPHLRERGTYVEVVQSTSGEEILLDTSWRLEDTPGGVRFASPNVGEHNDYVFGELLGLSPEGVKRLAGTGKIEIPRDLR